VGEGMIVEVLSHVFLADQFHDNLLRYGYN
jgi:hypothetical protein